MPDILGSAAITWSATSEAVSQRVHLLSAPLRELTFGHAMETFQRESLDRKTIENVAIGQGAPQLSGTVRYERNAHNLNDLLVAGSAGKPLTYYPNRNDPDHAIECTLVSPLAPVMLRADPQRGTMGDQSIQLVLRPTSSGKNFDPLLLGSNVIWFYRAGGDQDRMSIARDSTGAAYRQLSGTWADATSDVARITWDGIRPALLVEPAATNLIASALDLGSTWWSAVGGGSASSGQDDPFGATNAWRLIAASSSDGISQSFDVDSSGYLSVSAFVRHTFDVAQSTEGHRLVLASSDGTEVAAALFVFDGKDLTTVTGATTDQILRPATRSKDWWRIEIGTTAAQSTGTFTLQLIAAQDSTGELDVYGPQAELSRYATSFIRTTTSGTASRVADDVAWTFDGRPAALTLYAKVIEVGALREQTITGAPGPVLFVGQSTNPSDGLPQSLAILASSSGDFYHIEHINGLAITRAFLSNAAPLGSETELIGHLFDDGSVQLIQINSETGREASAVSTANPFQAQWTTPVITLGSYDRSTSTGRSRAPVALEVGFMARGQIDADGCRRIAGERL